MKRMNYKVFIVEGEEREVRIIKNLKANFFKNGESLIITLPAGQNTWWRE